MKHKPRVCIRLYWQFLANIARIARHPVTRCLDKYDTWSARQVATKRHHESPFAIRDEGKATARHFFFNNISDGMNVVTFHTLDVPASMPRYIAFLQYMQSVAVHCSVLK